MFARFLSTAVGIALLCACSGSSENAATPSPSPGLVKAKVTLTAFDPNLKWVPTQFAPRIVEMQSVSLPNVWPKDGDIVAILCTLEGAPYGNGDTRWYSILVPPDKLNSEAAGVAEKIDGGYKAYLEAMWLPDARNVPSC